jgi:hypothetical protein
MAMTIQMHEMAQNIGFEGDSAVDEREVSHSSNAITSVQAEAVYFQASDPLRLFSGVCFLTAAGFAVFAPGKFAPVLVGLMAAAVLMAGLGRVAAIKRFRHEMERRALAQGLAPERAREQAIAALEPDGT